MKRRTSIYIRLYGGEVNLDILKETVDFLRRTSSWTFGKWSPSPALVDKGTKSSRQFVGQNYDPKHFDLVSNGWTHDHCEVCTRRISADEIVEGYTFENEWICPDCFDNFIEPQNLQGQLDKFEKIAR